MILMPKKNADDKDTCSNLKFVSVPSRNNVGGAALRCSFCDCLTCVCCEEKEIIANK